MWEASFRELSAVAARQQGIITSAQADRVGVDRAALDHLREAGLLLALDADVFQIASSSTAPRYAYPYAAWLLISPGLFRWERPEAPADDAVLSHESACQLHGLGSVPAPLTVFTAPTERPAPRAARIHVSPLAPDEVMVVTGLPVTTPHRTLVDLVRDWTGHEQVGKAIFDAVRRDLVDLGALYADLTPLAAEHHFPLDGRDFLRYFVPDLPPESLPSRNRRAYAALYFPDRVAAVRERVRPVVTAARAGSGSTGASEPPAEEAALVQDIAAEIVGRIGYPDGHGSGNTQI
jgi:hypothetical protein